MEKQFIKPDFSNNIVNISATIAAYLGCPNDKPTLPELKEALERDPKNIIFLILDGMGVHPLEKNLPRDSFFRTHTRRVLTSVFPSTTTNATTTFLTNKYPMEHGWFGWSLYFEELKRAVDIYPESDSQTGEPIERGYVKRRLPIEPYYRQAKTDRTVRVAVPSYWDHGDAHRHVCNTPEELFACLGEICNIAGKQFVYAYCGEPDSTMHRFGVTSEEARKVIEGLEEGAENLLRGARDTLLIVTADHGQVDIGGRIELYRDEELTSLLDWPPFLEARAAAFKVKEGRKEAFRALFKQKYGADFTLFETEELIRAQYFGACPANEHAKLLADYIAVGKTDKIMALTPLSHPFKGHHTSLTEEMQVPLILAVSSPM